VRNGDHSCTHSEKQHNPKKKPTCPSTRERDVFLTRATRGRGETVRALIMNEEEGSREWGMKEDIIHLPSTESWGSWIFKNSQTK